MTTAKPLPIPAVTITEAAAALGCSEPTMRRRIASGEVETLPRVSRRAPVRVPLEELRRLLATAEDR